MKYLIPSLTVALLLVSSGVHAQTQELSTRGQQIDKIAAVVNEGVVLKSQVDQQYETVVARLKGQEGQMPPAQVIRQQVLERLVLQEIQAQRAERLGIAVSDEMLNSALRDVAQRNSIPFDQMPTAMARQGVDYAAYREDMRREIALSLLRQRDVLARIYVSPRELQQALDRLFHQCLQLPSFCSRKSAQVGQQLGPHLGREFFLHVRHLSCLDFHFFLFHDISR